MATPESTTPWIDEIVSRAHGALLAIMHGEDNDPTHTFRSIIRDAINDGTRARWQPIATAPRMGPKCSLTDGSWKRTGYWARRIETWSVDTAVSLEAPTHWGATPRPTDRRSLDHDDEEVPAHPLVVRIPRVSRPGLHQPSAERLVAVPSGSLER
jgi:hypothetical protein